MPSPIASRVDDHNRSWESTSTEDSTCEDRPLVSSSAASPGDESACSSSQDDGPGTSAPASGIRGPHAEAHAEDGDYYADAYMLRGRDPRSGVEIEAFSATWHQGERERAVQAAMARIGGSTDDGHFAARGEVFTAHAQIGLDNQDGSSGFGISMGASVVGAEVTGTLGPASLTAGASIGSTIGASLGVRDGDGDGKLEACGRLEFGVGAVGLCVEKWW